MARSPTGSFCEYLGRCLFQNVENADGTRLRSRYRANGTLDIAAARDLRSKRTQWHAWSALSEQIRLRNELWATWQRYKFSAEEHRPSMVAPSDRASVPVERHASADLVLMIAIAQGQA